MKKLKLLLLLPLILLMINCSKEEDGSNSVSPSDPDAVSEVLVIPNAEVVNSSSLPASSDASVAPTVSNMDINISYSAGGQIYLPSDVAAPSQNNIVGVYVQVEGASTYFDVPINANTSAGLISIPIDLPSIVGPGNFTLLLQFYDSAGNVGLIYEINITVTDPSNCDTTKVSGGEGLTSNIFDASNRAGIITLEYETYTVPDKIDIFQNGVWLGGTGPQTDRSTLRRAANCNVATVAKGYIGAEGQFVFPYNPAMGREIEVVVSGCENGGTAWEYTFSCPEEMVAGEGSFSYNGNTYSGTCIELPATQCSTGKDVVIASVTGSAGYSVIVYNMPDASSGTFQLTPFSEANGCELFILDNFGLTDTSGSLTKTGPNSFSFSYTAGEGGSSYSVTGSGNY